MRSCGSLPPLVEGKIHGYLKLVIDAIAWSRGSPGRVSVFPSWWGEPSSVRFRPVNVAEHDAPADESAHVYAIKTNLNLFKEYVRNCETLELVVVADKTNSTIGSAEITDLVAIFEYTCVSKYYTVVSLDAEKIGEIHVSLSLSPTIILDTSLAPLKSMKPEVTASAHICDAPSASELKYENFLTRKDDYRSKPPETYTSSMYKSILKGKKHTAVEDIPESYDAKVTGKLVAQAIAKAQRLRGALMKETQTIHLSDLIDEQTEQPDLPLSVENEANLYQYMLGRDMTSGQEKDALHTLRSMSPASSLVQFASDSIGKCKAHKLQEANTTVNKKFTERRPLEIKESNCDSSKELLPLDHIDTIQIVVESFNLNDAGYRRVKSSCLSCSDNMPLHVTYIVQYDVSLLHPKYSKEKQFKHALIKVSSKSQADMAVYFKHSGIYNICITKLRADFALKFKLFIRHLNQKTPTELGIGSIYVRDIIKSDTWCISQHVGIINKGIKIGELDITAQLGSKSDHFGKQYIDTIVPNTKSVPSLRAHCLSSKETNKVIRATGRESKSENRVPINSERVANCLPTKYTLNSYSPQHQSSQRDRNTDGTQINIKHQESVSEEKIVLHGLIYIPEGRQLPISDTYLICKTCWRDDNSMSYICENTNNPVYQFRQSVQFVYGKDLLDRVKNNYIIIEVYGKYNGADELLGLAKLSVHQFYLAYNNAQILPRLLSSKYPVISVDGWVPVMDPITGKACGELLALVALGTVYQIEALEVLRGYANINVREDKKQPHGHAHLHASHNFYQAQDVSKHNIPCAEQNLNRSAAYNSTECYAHSVPKEDLDCLSLKTQAIQTDITMISKIKEDNLQANADKEHTVLHKLVDQLNQVLIGGKSNANTAAQTETDFSIVHPNADEASAIDLNVNNISDDSDSVQLHLPTDAYRSVGVGAEYEEDFQQQSRSYNCNNVQSHSSVEQHPPQGATSDYKLDSFKAVVEIESALHLTKTERGNEIVEPSTYVTFQAQKSGPVNCLKSYISTDIASYTCNPKWNWKADVRLPTELLLNNEKRLILKIWHVNNPGSSREADLDRDIVLGFAAIDLTVLLNGFPMISGWFHIMDFTGKCKGQIQVKVTPLDNLSSLTKSASTARSTRGKIYASPQSNWIVSNPLDIHQSDMEQNHKRPSLPIETRNEGSARDVTTPNISTMNGMHFLENESMSFLSLSLKQKLTELDEITKRLQSRLHDVTSTAFEDEFDNEFDVNEPNCFNDNCEAANNDPSTLQRKQTSQQAKNISTSVDNGNHSDKDTAHICSIGINTIDNRIGVSPASPASNHSVENSENCHRLRNDHDSGPPYRPTFDNMNDYPARGAKVHINHLLDKLSLQPTTRLASSGSVPLGRNIIELLQNLHQSNNNLEHGNKCRPNTAVCTVPTQTDNSGDEIIQTSASGSVSHFATNDDKFCQSVPRPQVNNKVSDAVRDELMAEEDNGTFKTDELSTYLMASNVRHMDLDTMVNPLVYSHLMPDMDVPVVMSPEGDAAEQLDNYYSKVFGDSIDETLGKRQTKSSSESSLVSNQNNASIASAKNAKHSRISPSGLSTNVDGNINLTVVHQSCYDDLLATNSREFSGSDKSSMTEIPMIPGESACSHSTATSESSLSRQAPDGGNPVEDNPNQLTKQRQDDSRESSIS